MVRNWALKKRAQYQKVYKFGIAWGDKLVVIKAFTNGLEFSRYGFSVSKSLGKAVTRNRTRRLLKEIVRTTKIRSGWDIVFIARKDIIKVDYHRLKKSIERLLFRADLLVEKNEVASTGVN